MASSFSLSPHSTVRYCTTDYIVLLYYYLPHINNVSLDPQSAHLLYYRFSRVLVIPDSFVHVSNVRTNRSSISSVVCDADSWQFNRSVRETGGFQCEGGLQSGIY